MYMFSKRLTQTDVSKRLAIPADSLRWFPSFPDGGHEIELEVWDNDAVDGSGKMLWNFCFSIRRTGKYLKPVFSTGWLDFVRAKGLKVGDEVRVYRTENTIKLFGTVVCRLSYRIEVVPGVQASWTNSQLPLEHQSI